MAIGNLKIENYVPAVKFNKGLLTKLPVVLSGSAATLTVAGAISAPGGLSSTGTVTTLSGGAATSGGNTTPAVVVASTTTGSGVGIYFGAGAPTITAPQGSLYLNTTGSSTSTRAYINTTGSTTWTAITTAA